MNRGPDLEPWDRAGSENIFEFSHHPPNTNLFYSKVLRVAQFFFQSLLIPLVVPSRSGFCYRSRSICFFVIFDFWHCRLKLPKNGLSTYKAGRTQNALTFKPRYKNCPDFDSDAPPTPGHPGLKEIAWEARTPILRHQNRRYAFSLYPLILPTALALPELPKKSINENRHL